MQFLISDLELVLVALLCSMCLGSYKTNSPSTIHIPTELGSIHLFFVSHLTYAQSLGERDRVALACIKEQTMAGSKIRGC